MIEEAPNNPEIQSVPPILLATPTIVPAKGAARWKKRLLFLGLGASLLGAVGWATSPRPRLLRPPESIAASIEPSIEEIVRKMDAAMDGDIERHHLTMAKPADWHVVARRLSLAMVGNGLSLEEIRALEQIPEAQRATWWTEYLLRDRRAADYLAERFTRATVGTNQGPFLVFRRRKYRNWLADEFQKNTPYDVVVRQLIQGKGSWTDAPQVNFLTATMDEADGSKPDAIRLAGRTSRSFLAQRIDCLQCHQDYLGKISFTDDLNDASTFSSDEPSDSSESSDAEDSTESRMGEQTDFHQLAAFFSGVRMENPFVGLQNKSTDYKYTYLDSEEEVDVVPTVPYRRDLLPNDGDARERLAAWVTHRENKAFARATVNRMWAILFGKPMVEPVDSIPLNGPFPAGFELLAEDFASHGYDLKRLIRVIVATKAFHRDSRIDAESSEASDEEEVSLKHEQYWAVFPLTQLRPEQVAASIHQSSRIKAIDESSSIFAQLEFFGGVNDFINAYGDRGEDEFNAQSVSIPQRLLVMNGSYVSERIAHNPLLNASTRIAILTEGDDKLAVETVYLSTLNRYPTGAELNAFCERIHGTKDVVRSQAMGSIFWALINSTEFQWNH